MRKKQRIGHVEITNSNIIAYDTEGKEVKLTRRQREIFRNYKRDLIKNIETEFGTAVCYVINDDFFIKKNGEVVYSRIAV